MTHCSLSGNLPHDLMEMGPLESLDLSFNLFSGEIPVEWSARHLVGSSSLKHLDLSHNRLEGTRISEWTKQASLTQINLSHNSFSGPLPVELFGRPYRLQKLWLNNNFFTGNFGLVSRMGSLEVLDVSSNNLVGPVPMRILFSPGL